jgi:L-ascorbate metabolism protein UlaG (beta-lactamase superfamily)
MPTSVTRLGHATVLLDFDGVRVLTDPWFSEKPGYSPGETRAIGRAADLPHLDGIVVSHGHYDHFDLAALADYPDKTIPMVVKRGIGGRASAAGWRQVVEVDPWETATIGPVRVTAAPARHLVPEVTFVLEGGGEGGGRTVFFGGDTMRIAELDEVGRRFTDIDLALLPINGLALRPLLNRQVVMDAAQAADLTAVLRPRLAVPIHYAFTAGPVRERLLVRLDRRTAPYVDAVADRAPDTAVHVLDPGAPLTV